MMTIPLSRLLQCDKKTTTSATKNYYTQHFFKPSVFSQLAAFYILQNEIAYLPGGANWIIVITLPLAHRLVADALLHTS